MKMLEIRLATPEETDAVTACVHAAFSYWTDIIGIRPRALDTDFGAFIEQKQVHIGLVENEIVAVLAAWPVEDAFYVDTLAVNPNSQKGGFGREFLAFAETLAHEAKKTKISLCTNEKMESNRSYYQKLGFTEIGYEVFDDGRRAVWLEKALTK
jgi:ribosomal protein S18 acetylase RimI-like enzyme